MTSSETVKNACDFGRSEAGSDSLIAHGSCGRMSPLTSPWTVKHTHTGGPMSMGVRRASLPSPTARLLKSLVRRLPRRDEQVDEGKPLRAEAGSGVAPRGTVRPGRGMGREQGRMCGRAARARRRKRACGAPGTVRDDRKHNAYGISMRDRPRDGRARRGDGDVLRLLVVICVISQKMIFGPPLCGPPLFALLAAGCLHTPEVAGFTRHAACG